MPTMFNIICAGQIGLKTRLSASQWVCAVSWWQPWSDFLSDYWDKVHMQGPNSALSVVYFPKNKLSEYYSVPCF